MDNNNEPKKDESPRDAWTRLGGNRTSNAIKLIRSIGGMNNERYEYTDEEVKSIADTLRKEVADMEKQLADKEPKPLFAFADTVQKRRAPDPMTSDDVRTPTA